MRPSALFLICVSLLCLFVRCRPDPPQSATQPVIERSSVPPTLHDSSQVEENDSTLEARRWRENCPRGIPEAILKPDSLPGRAFALSADSMMAFERARFPDGDSLTIEHAGCEWYTLIFHFTTAQPVATAETLPMAIRLMRKTIRRLETPTFFLNQTNALERLVKAGKARVGEEYNFGNKDDNAYMELLTVAKPVTKPDGRMRISVTIAMGPL